MAFSPVEASKSITEKYYRYLKTSFSMNPPYKDEFEKLIDSGNSFASGPYLDVTDAFDKGQSIEKLIAEGLLPVSFSRINMNQTRTLYKHQERALRKVLSDNRNIVVSTGTGSGKTESFLLPILADLVKEFESGELNDGVRALLIYPMNALANDQTERLRSILKDFPEISFGVYTGQTKQKEEDALAEYKSLNNNASPIPNEYISRDKMINNPPHILITNYAMLEYLMLRPRDSVFFSQQHAKKWKYIVFDEAHVYSGSTGIEVSMLFRRLKAKLQNNNIRFILTSATLGDEKDNFDVADFAEKLCNAHFSEEDIIRAKRIKPDDTKTKEHFNTSFYSDLASLIDSDANDEVLLKSIGIESTLPFSEVIYDIVITDTNYWDIRKILTNTQTVKEVAKKMQWTEEQLTDFVKVASVAEKNGGKLFDARYHMFLRATESVFVTLAPSNKVMLNRSNYYFDKNSGDSYKVFEAATCSYCHSTYLVGKIKNNKLEQYNFSDEIESKEIFLLGTEVSDTDDNHTLEDESIEIKEYELCPYCGYIRETGSRGTCEHNAESYVKVYKSIIKNESGTLTKCLSCENVNNMGVLRMFFSGQEASTSVIGTALFEELPSYKITIQEQTADDEFAPSSDEFGGGTKNKERIAKQFIAFSDSRQAAAFYSSYLTISYNNILYKRVIVEALKKLQNDHEYFVPEFVNMVADEFSNHKLRGKAALTGGSGYTITKEAWKAVLSELVDNNGNTSLSHYGLIGINIDVSGSYSKFKINDDEFKTLCSFITNSMLADAAIKYDAQINESDIEDFTHNGAVYSYTLSDSSKRMNKSFLPSRAGLSNKRIDYIKKILDKKGVQADNDSIVDFLKRLWERVLLNQEILLLESANEYRVNSKKITISKPSKWYICKKCHKITCNNIENVCPSYHCDGELAPYSPELSLNNNHYYRMYNDMELRDLRVVEHTAQLDRDMAYDYQKRFKQKEIDILSCSTTFEMGVDVGSLETVFMRNMPPSPSNYAQRAGRAGRSSHSAAYALTFCNKSSHDFSFFANPVSMIKGRIEPPKYSVENDKIAIRHLYASAFSFFWNVHPEYFKNVGTFFEPGENGKTGYSIFCDYLLSNPAELKRYLNDFLPQVLSEKFKVDSYKWVQDLIGVEGVLKKAKDSYDYEKSVLDETKNRLFEEGKKTDYLMQRIKNLTSENILSFLSRKNVLPKYGFPVDSVEMSVFDNKKNAGFGLQLQRDLSMAISEYAPGSQIVANNNLITSRYIKKIPNIGWKMYNYVRCENCNTLNLKIFSEQSDDNNKIDSCCQCHQPFAETPGVFIIPEQGFAADGNSIRRPGLKKPERTYRGEISYVGISNKSELAGNVISNNKYNVGNAIVRLKTNQNDEMAVLNTSPFYVCEHCGYAEVDEKHFVRTKIKKHKTNSGSNCSNQLLTKYALGYRFLTDVVIMDFENKEINSWDEGMSILYGLLRGISRVLNIEENDISGCLVSNPVAGRLNYSLVFFDSTPGGAGHVKRLNNEDVLNHIFKQTYKIMTSCSCGGQEGDSSCYSCLRSYKNQKYHDALKRRYVIEFLESTV